MDVEGMPFAKVDVETNMDDTMHTAIARARSAAYEQEGKGDTTVTGENWENLQHIIGYGEISGDNNKKGYMTSDYFKHPMWEIMEALEVKPPYRHIKLYPYQGKNFTVVAYDMHVEIQSTHENGETVHSLKRRAIMAMDVNMKMQATMSIHRLLIDPNDGTACPGSALDERADVHATGIRGGETLQITTNDHKLKQHLSQQAHLQKVRAQEKRAEREREVERHAQHRAAVREQREAQGRTEDTGRKRGRR